MLPGDHTGRIGIDRVNASFEDNIHAMFMYDLNEECLHNGLNESRVDALRGKERKIEIGIHSVNGDFGLPYRYVSGVALCLSEEFLEVKRELQKHRKMQLDATHADFQKRNTRAKCALIITLASDFFLIIVTLYTAMRLELNGSHFASSVSIALCYVAILLLPSLVCLMRHYSKRADEPRFLTVYKQSYGNTDLAKAPVVSTEASSISKDVLIKELERVACEMEALLVLTRCKTGLSHKVLQTLSNGISESFAHCMPKSNANGHIEKRRCKELRKSILRSVAGELGYTKYDYKYAALVSCIFFFQLAAFLYAILSIMRLAHQQQLFWANYEIVERALLLAVFVLQVCLVPLVVYGISASLGPIVDISFNKQIDVDKFINEEFAPVAVSYTPEPRQLALSYGDDVVTQVIVSRQVA